MSLWQSLARSRQTYNITKLFITFNRTYQNCILYQIQQNLKKNRTEFVPVTKSGPKKTALTCQKKILKQSAPYYVSSIIKKFEKISVSKKKICNSQHPTTCPSSKCLCIIMNVLIPFVKNKHFFCWRLSPLKIHYYTVFPVLNYYHIDFWAKPSTLN